MATSCVRHVHTLNLWIDHEGHGWGIAWGLPVMCCASIATCGRYDEALNTNQKCRKTSRTERSFAKRGSQTGRRVSVFRCERFLCTCYKKGAI